MTQEERDLIYKDACGRLPYHPYAAYTLKDGTIVQARLTGADDGQYYGYILDTWGHIPDYDVKLYLRSISSMTDAEMDKLFDILHIDKDGKDDDWIKINDELGIKFFFPTGKWVEDVAEAYNYLNSIHIDYRFLIPKGLAIEASKGMYEQKINT